MDYTRVLAAEVARAEAIARAPPLPAPPGAPPADDAASEDARVVGAFSHIDALEPQAPGFCFLCQFAPTRRGEVDPNISEMHTEIEGLATEQSFRLEDLVVGLDRKFRRDVAPLLARDRRYADDGVPQWTARAIREHVTGAHTQERGHDQIAYRYLLAAVREEHARRLFRVGPSGEREVDPDVEERLYRNLTKWIQLDSCGARATARR